ncbi:DUF1450 domain-containing protein [Clostridium senegalense]|uniref:DUF1450 domain-containing protein n=1 Tax=Clostridium senegalense TaxID=1465809 RepID=UPI0002884064|nr:DUF1450 domain-containing protein [Clostridium senegalense]
MNKKRISFCTCNADFEYVKERIDKEFPEHETTINKCIGACDKCSWDFIARVDGELIVSESKESLYENIKLVLKK